MYDACVGFYIPQLGVHILYESDIIGSLIITVHIMSMILPCDVCALIVRRGLYSSSCEVTWNEGVVVVQGLPVQ